MGTDRRITHYPVALTVQLQPFLEITIRQLGDIFETDLLCRPGDQPVITVEDGREFLNQGLSLLVNGQTVGDQLAIEHLKQ